MLNNEHDNVNFGTFDPQIVKNETKLFLEKLDQKSWIYDEVSRDLAAKICLEKVGASPQKLEILKEAEMVLAGAGALVDLDSVIDKVCQKLISLILEIYQRPVGADQRFQELKYQMMLVIAQVYMSRNHETSFPFGNSQEVFDWDQFWIVFDADYVKRVVLQAIK